ncbi:MAG: hypothetical protein E7616_03020 [Ruminococcaceae bacterium]|nr:hypothetical protein [Oscillospiraceae bacterium]
MKKFIALLLSLVIMVPVLGVGVYAEENKCEEVAFSLIRFAVEKNRNVKNLLAKLGVYIGNMEETIPEAGGNNNSQRPSDKQESLPNQESENEKAENSTVSDFEKKVVELVNIERAKYGLKPLTLSVKLSDGARLKSKDMHDKKYFSHTSPTYGSPFDMMKSLGITYRTAGENIAMGYHSPEAVVEAWMNSEGHRANILKASYTEIGVGYIADGGYFTQWFRG